MGRVTQTTSSPPQVQSPEVQDLPVKETKPIPVIELPLAIHNLEPISQTIISKPIIPPKPIVIEIDPTTVLEITKPTPQVVVSLPPIQLQKVVEIEEPTKIKIPLISVPQIEIVKHDKEFIASPDPVPYAPPTKTESPLLTPAETAIPESSCLGRKLSPGDIVDGDILPPSEKKWNPTTDNKVVRWFDMQWKSDGNYELVNWCVFMTHMELELRKL